jgi:hypothetical protein
MGGSSSTPPESDPMRRWAMLGTFTATMGALASCSSSPASSEKTGSTTAALRAPSYPLRTPPTARKVCQLIGDTDFETTLPTKSQSGSRGVAGTDLGFPILDDTQTIRFFFGDTNPPDSGGRDVLGYTKDLTLGVGGDAECPFLQFAKPNAASDFATNTITLDGNVLGDFQTPIGGFFDPAKRQFYVFFQIANTLGTFDKADGYGETAVLGTSEIGAPNRFVRLTTAPTNLDHFVVVWPVLVDASAVPQIPLPGTGDQVVLMWGAGHPYRKSAVYLAAVRLSEIANPRSWRYQDGASWTTNPSTATPVYAPEPVQCVGEFSVSFNTVLHQWMMVYACGDQPKLTPDVGRGVYVRTADDPLGPWSPPAVIFSPGADAGYGHFMHTCNPRGVLSSDGTTLVSPPTDSYHPPTDICPGIKPDAKCIDETLPPPAGCAPPAASNPQGLGCCTLQNACCDAAYSPATDDHGSNTVGGEYAPYPIQLYSQATSFVPRSTTFASGTSLYFTMSTWNPYVVDFMRSEINLEDADGDSVANDVDDCPAAYDPNQENCNLDSENAWNEQSKTDPTKPPVPLLGDACDPVPCPQSNANRITRTTAAAGASSGGCSPNGGPSLGESCVFRAIHDQIDFAPIGASPTFVESLNRAPPPAATVSNVTTHARFCQHNPQRGSDCNIARNLRDDLLDRTLSANDESLDPLHPWHRITLSPKVRRVDPRTGQILVSYDTSRPRGSTLDPATYGSDTATLRWEYNDDNLYWLGLGPTPSPNAVVIPPPLDYDECNQRSIFGDGTCLKGRLWLHGDTPVGSDVNNQNADGTFVGFHGIQLANHYFDMKPDVPTNLRVGGLGVRLAAPFFLARTLSDPGPEQAPAWNTFGQGEAFPFVTEIGSTSIFAVRDLGERIDVTSSLGVSFAQSLRAASFTWTNAVESSPFAGNQARPTAIALSSDGTQVLMHAASQNGKFVLSQQLDLIARKAYNPDVWTDASQSFSSAVRFTIPSSIPVFEGSADSQSCSISWGISADNSVTCTFQGPGQTTGGDTQVVNPDRIAAYLFQSCSNGAKAGDVAEVTGLRLHVENGDGQFGTTSVRLPLSVWESDAAGFSVPPPVPSSTAARPSPRRDFASVYSRAANAVFVIGGHTPAGALLDDIWFQPLGGDWKQVELPHGVLGHPLSATYSWADRRLWVLDQIERVDHSMETRLLRIERETGAFEVVAKTHSSGEFDKRGLVVDPRGNVLLYASSTRGDRHRFAQVTVKGSSFGVAVTDRERRALITAPIVDLNGYRFLFVPKEHSDNDDCDRHDPDRHHLGTPSDGVRLKSLPLHSAKLKELEDLLR